MSGGPFSHRWRPGEDGSVVCAVCGARDAAPGHAGPGCPQGADLDAIGEERGIGGRDFERAAREWWRVQRERPA